MHRRKLSDCSLTYQTNFQNKQKYTKEKHSDKKKSFWNQQWPLCILLQQSATSLLCKLLLDSVLGNQRLQKVACHSNAEILNL